jgi:hypothetical protein
MPRTNHRPRKSISAARARLLPFVGFRYSTTRDAYVLRGVGNHAGPVFQVATHPRPGTEADTTAPDRVSAG